MAGARLMRRHTAEPGRVGRRREVKGEQGLGGPQRSRGKQGVGGGGIWRKVGDRLGGAPGAGPRGSSWMRGFTWPVKQRGAAGGVDVGREGGRGEQTC